VQAKKDSDEDHARRNFRRSDDGTGYEVTAFDTEKHGSLRSTFHIVKLGDAFFVDIVGPEAPAGAENAPFPTIPAHAIGRIWVDEGAVRWRLRDEAGVNKQVKAKNFQLAYADLSLGLVLTAPTDELRKFVTLHADDKEASRSTTIWSKSSSNSSRKRCSHAIY
jgi:hypothetical protein